ncbi:hypothetical protein SISNIDRAFT_415120, partial [Sistotremastrum niveocremeum HHB9708]
VTIYELHKLMAHISPKAAEKLVRDGLVTGIKLITKEGEPKTCGICPQAKQTRKPHPKIRESNFRKK